MPNRRSWIALLAPIAIATAFTPAHALDREHRLMAEAAIDRGIAFLRAQQGDDGSWTPRVGPAITALVLTAMLDEPDIDPADPQAAAAIAFILSHAREDGGVHGGFLENYNTAISASALTRVEGDPRVAEVLDGARAYLTLTQWHNQVTPEGGTVDASHPFYGGSGYGRHGRPDLSNTHIMLQALHDMGVNCKDPAFQRAMVFVSRCQGVAVNDLFADVIENDGGFIYATSISKDAVGVPESKASPEMIDEGKAGRPVSGLRTYGSMTYSGFKSYVYAELWADDPRVVAAREWIGRNYTFDRNPGMPETMDQQGLYYMYLSMARALDAWGETYVVTPDGTENDWANDLIAALAQRQRDDGSWVNAADRWMEDNPVLVTAYGVLALQAALD